MSSSLQPIQGSIIDIIKEISQDWDTEADGVMAADTQLIEDLNFASLDFIHLVVAIEEKFQQKLGFQELLMQDGDYIDDLSIEQLVNFVENKLNSIPPPAVAAPPKTASPTSAAAPTAKLSAAKAAKFREIIENRITQLESHSLAPAKLDKNKGKNPPAIFILSPPRSGSTLLRVMLAGHSQLFAPPELHLLSYQSLKQRKMALDSDASSHLLQGTIRALMQLKNCSAIEAQSLMEEYESQNLTTKEFYALLQQFLDGKTLVDKTPTYASHINILRQVEEHFENPLYIHLLRHPCGMIRSYTEAKLERIVPIMNESSFERTELAELTWLVSQENILEFLQDIPSQRQVHIKFEELVQTPEKSINYLCQFLGIELEADMLKPYQEKSQRMTDGVNQVSEMSGDLKFHLHQGIDATAADAWKQYYNSDFLSEESRKLAETLGYKNDI